MVSPLSAGLDMYSRLEFIQRGFDENTSHGNNDTTTGFVGKFTTHVYIYIYTVVHGCVYVIYTNTSDITAPTPRPIDTNSKP